MAILGFGCMRLPVLDKNDLKSIDKETVNKMFDTYLENGFNYFDTAYMYHMHTSEIAVRESLVKRHPRDKYILATKLPLMFLNTKEDRERIFNEQLEKCGVEYFDYYLLHDLGKGNYEKAKALDCFAFIEDLKKAGKVKKIGFSFHDEADLLNEILSLHPEMEFVQLQINYLDWENEAIQSRKCYEIAKKYGKPIIAMEPVKGGKLTDVPDEVKKMYIDFNPGLSVASWAIRFAASLEGVENVLSGMSDMEQVNDNIKTMKNFKPITPKESEILSSAVKLINDDTTIPCTSCMYCEEWCPQKIAIPKYFALFNAEKKYFRGGFSIQKAYYTNAAKTHGKASECIDCKECEKNCPQHIHIADWMKEVAAALEIPQEMMPGAVKRKE